MESFYWEEPWSGHMGKNTVASVKSYLIFWIYTITFILSYNYKLEIKTEIFKHVLYTWKNMFENDQNPFAMLNPVFWYR